jgi:hypothetical protein
MSYNDKHPTNPIALRPIYNAIQDTPRILDSKNRFVPDVKKIQLLRSFANLPRQQLGREISLC